MLEAFFSSRVRVRLLTIFLLNPDSRFHARALAQRVGAHYSAVWKELKNLEQVGLLFAQPSGGSRFYSVNSQFPILAELRSIIVKTAGIGDVIRHEMEGLGQIEAVFVYGSIAAGDADHQSDIDLMLIGKIDLVHLALVIDKIEKTLERSVNYIIYTPEEWREKQRRHEPFIENVLNSPKLMLIGDKNALRTPRTARAHQALQSAPRRDSKATQGRRARPRYSGAQPSR